MILSIEWRVRVGKTDFLASQLEITQGRGELSYDFNKCLYIAALAYGETLKPLYTRTSIYRVDGDANVKVGEAVALNPVWKLDVRNCHFPQYYMNKKCDECGKREMCNGCDLRPLDTQVPKVTYFWTFEAPTRFEVLWANEVLSPETHVLGGASAVGYGFFKIK